MEIKMIIAGSRTFTNYDILRVNVSSFLIENDIALDMVKHGTIISGGAIGTDSLGERYANEYNIKIHKYIPDWGKSGKVAGLIRNEEMAKVATHAIIFWDGKSRGSEHMIKMAKKYKLVLSVIEYPLTLTPK